MNFTTSIQPNPAPRTSTLMTSWNRDWERWCRTSAVDLPGLLAGCGADRSVEINAADQALATLVSRAATDDLAGRVVLQRVLPALVLVAARRSRLGGDRRRIFDDLVSNAWVVIRTYPIDRRPSKIASNIVRDAEYLTCVRPFRLRSGQETPIGDRAEFETPETESMEPATLVALLLSEALAAGVAPDDVTLLARLHLEGVRVEVLAEESGCTTRTIRSRRLAATRRLAEFAACA